MRDRDVMNLLDQLELYTLQIGQGRVTQQDYWLFIYKSMKSGQMINRTMEGYLIYKLRTLGVQVSEGTRIRDFHPD